MKKQDEKLFLKYIFCVLLLMTAIAGYTFNLSSNWGWFLICSMIIYYFED